MLKMNASTRNYETMSIRKELTKRRILSEFGVYNFLRVGNFLPASILEQVCVQNNPKDTAYFQQTLEELVSENSVQREALPRPGYRLTLKGYEFCLSQPRGLRALLMRLLERFA